MGFPGDCDSQIRFISWDSPKYIFALLEALDVLPHRPTPSNLRVYFTNLAPTPETNGRRNSDMRTILHQ